MNVITIDFETFYSTEVGFNKHTTEEYVRHEQFEVIGFAIKENDEATTWHTGTHAELAEVLKGYDWKNSFVLAHNTTFDGSILSWHFGVNPKGWLDTLSMARAVHGVDVGGSLAKLATRYNIGEKGTEVDDAKGKRRLDFTPEDLAQYGRYCINDTELCYTLFHHLMLPGLGGGFPSKELKVIDITLRMFIHPALELDLPLLEQHLEDVKDRKERLLAAVAADKDQLMSNDKFAELLRQLRVDPPRKISPTTGKEVYAFAKTDEGLKELQDHPDSRVQALVAARLGNKSTLEETRTQRFIDIAKRGKLPVPLKYYAAHTGRWGGCLVADTLVLVYDKAHGPIQKRIVDVLADDLVWDGLEFVSHEGAQFSGYQKVISWDNVTGTTDHVVYTEAGQISLLEAMQGNHRIQTPDSPSQDALDSARKFIKNN